MSLFGLLDIARQGVAAQSAAITTAGQNVANVATPGYARRTALLEAGPVGGGVRFAGAVRTVDRFAQAHVLDQQARLGAANARSSALAEIEATIAPPTGSIGEQAIALGRAFHALTGFPTDPSLRADVLGRAAAFAETVATTATALQKASEDLLGRAHDVVAAVNANLSRIADLNRQIATAVGAGGDAGGLRDQRDVAIREVAEHVGARVIEDSSGRVTLFVAGSALVEGDRASPLGLDLDANGKMRFFVTGATRADITSRVDTGTLGGLREARDVDLAMTAANLDAYAFDVATAFNAVHASGYGLDGGTGRPLFDVSTTVPGAALSLSLSATVAGRPDRIAAAGAASDLPGGNDVARRLADLAESRSFAGATLAERFAALATGVGLRKLSADAEVQLRTDTLAVAESLADSASGVSIDEEMVQLTKYQRAFEASTRILRAADELLEHLMTSLG
jgi:flagellar hook-associated protein 1 FlgK